LQGLSEKDADLRVFDMGNSTESINYESLHCQQSSWSAPTMSGKTANKAQQRQRMGRPRTPTDVARRNRVVTLITDSEHKKLKTVADDKGQSVSALVHQVISQFLRRR